MKHNNRVYIAIIIFVIAAVCTSCLQPDPIDTSSDHRSDQSIIISEESSESSDGVISDTSSNTPDEPQEDPKDLWKEITNHVPPFVAEDGFQIIDLTESWDTKTLLRNPDKGWFMVVDSSRMSLTDLHSFRDFEGSKHLMFAFAWNELEPNEGDYQWKLIDKHLELFKDVPDLTFSLYIYTKSTDSQMPYATPQWVVDAGAKGQMYPAPSGGAWENFGPYYDSTVYLQKLSQLHKAIGNRYKNAPLSGVYISSIGEFGTGSTQDSEDTCYSPSVIKKHLALYREAYPDLELYLPVDYILENCQTDDERLQVENAIGEYNIGLCELDINSEEYRLSWKRDLKKISTDTLYKIAPASILLADYGYQKANGFFKNEGADSEGVQIIAEAMDAWHPSYIGLIDDFKIWLTDNPTFSIELYNKAGYWYFPNSVLMPQKVTKGDPFDISVIWENHGVAPAYHTYDLTIRFKDADGSVISQAITESDNSLWMPYAQASEKYTLSSAKLNAGTYQVQIRLGNSEIPILLGLSQDLLDEGGFYTIGEIEVLNASN